MADQRITPWLVRHLSGCKAQCSAGSGPDLSDGVGFETDLEIYPMEIWKR